MTILHHPHSLPRQQRGAALVTGLLIMIVMTLIGITAMQSSITQSNLATNAQLNTIGFQSTETALARASNDASLLEKALDNGIQALNDGIYVATDTPDYNQFQAVLDIQVNENDTEDKTTIPINTAIQVTPLGQKATCSKATGTNGNQSTTVTTPICTVFELVASTAIGNSTQASTRHTQLSDRLMPPPPGGMPAYRPNQEYNNNEQQ
ncbi:MAG TPA: hypothetical protein ENI97_10260 [Gammaproteobacteria bacterium]|nr:hypothetical protein [Gammaproteobacteria bacterium]